MNDLPNRLSALGADTSPTIDDELTQALTAVADPAWQCLTHGDATFSNAFLQGDAVRLIDLEASGFRHALIDGCFFRIRYLHSVWAREIPVSLRRELDAHYREHVCGEDQHRLDTYDDSLAACSLLWLSGILKFLDEVEHNDVAWGLSSLRQRVVAGLEHFAELSQELNRYSACGKAAWQAAEEARRRWPSEHCTLKPYPALV